MHASPLSSSLLTMLVVNRLAGSLRGRNSRDWVYGSSPYIYRRDNHASPLLPLLLTRLVVNGLHGSFHSRLRCLLDYYERRQLCQRIHVVQLPRRLLLLPWRLQGLLQETGAVAGQPLSPPCLMYGPHIPPGDPDRCGVCLLLLTRTTGDDTYKSPPHGRSCCPQEGHFQASSPL